MYNGWLEQTIELTSMRLKWMMGAHTDMTDNKPLNFALQLI